MDGLEDTLGQAPLAGPLPATKQLSLDLNQGQVASEHGLGIHFWVLTATQAAHNLCDLEQVT